MYNDTYFQLQYNFQSQLRTDYPTIYAKPGLNEACIYCIYFATCKYASIFCCIVNMFIIVNFNVNILLKNNYCRLQ
jgi:hypothetical protein